MTRTRFWKCFAAQVASNCGKTKTCMLGSVEKCNLVIDHFMKTFFWVDYLSDFNLLIVKVTGNLNSFNLSVVIASFSM